jgi:fructose/tagatose bisphosphate aldolase
LGNLPVAMLVNPKDHLARARREGWALGGFNVYNLESARAVIAAGEELAAPVLVQTSEGAVKHFRPRYSSSWSTRSSFG